MQINQAIIGQNTVVKTLSVHKNKAPYLSNHLDDRVDDLATIVKQLVLEKGVFHLAVHFSSSQLVCWTLDNPYSFRVYTADDVFAENFTTLFSPMKTKTHNCIDKYLILPILNSLKELRKNASGSELRNASIHMMNGYIGLSFACDDTRYINYKDFVMPSTLSFPM